MGAQVDTELLNANHKARHDSSQWFHCFETLADARDRIRKQTGDKTFAHFDEAQLELLREAASQLSRYVSIANEHRSSANAEFERTQAILWPKQPARDLSDAAMVALGERMAADPSQITSNLEGQAYIKHCHNETCDKVAKDGCCGGKPSSDGHCFDYAGPCPRVQQIDQCTKFATDFVKWVDSEHEQAGLAAVDARLNSPPSLDMGVDYVGFSTGNDAATS